MKHLLDSYGVQVRKRQSQEYQPLDAIGDEQIDLKLIFLNWLETYSQLVADNNTKFAVIKNSVHEDKKGNSIHGMFGAGEFGDAWDVVHVADPKAERIRLTEHHASLRDLFFNVYLPSKSNHGALILHKIGNDGLIRIFRDSFIPYFNTYLPEYILEIEPTYFKVRKNSKWPVKTLEAVIYEKPTATQAVRRNSGRLISRKVATVVLHKGFNSTSIMDDLQAKDQVQDVVIETLAPYVQFKGIANYNVSCTAEMEIKGLKKKVKLQRRFEYNESRDITATVLEFKEDRIQVLLRESKVVLQELIDTGFL